MSTQSKRIVKRGYLFDRKGLLDRKRWYVLHQDVGLGVCVIEIFKDERAAARMGLPKGSINVHDIVKVIRVADRKQSFEILCPGVGYRFMANSDVEADEWVTSISGLILYRRETPSLCSPPLPGLTQPVSISHTLPIFTDTEGGDRSQPSSFPPHPTLPTPPDLSSSSPAAQQPSHSLSRRSSAEFAGAPFCSFPPPPSPPSSSSGSSMASGSNASYEQAWSVAVADVDTDVRFRVQVKESEGLAVSGAVDLVLGDGKLALHTPDSGRALVSWPIAALRRYGVNNVSLTIVTGRNCATGEGKFQFFTQQSRRVYSHLHAMAVSRAATKTHSLYRTGSGSGAPLTSPPCISEHSLAQPTAPRDFSTSLETAEDHTSHQSTATLC